MIKSYKISQASLDYIADGGAILGSIFDKLIEAGFVMTYRDEIPSLVFLGVSKTRCLTSVTITLKTLEDLVRLISIVGGIMISDASAPKNPCNCTFSRAEAENIIIIYDDYIE